MDYVDDAIRGKLSLPAVPRVVQRLLLLLRRSDVPIHAMSAELGQDPVLSARVLRMANSPFFAGHRQLASIDDAVAVVGTHALNTLVVACGVSMVFVEVPGVSMRDFWLHSAMTAAAAGILARQAGADAQAAYLAGLLHECGHLILCQAYPVLACKAFGGAPMLHGQALATTERKTFGVVHSAVSAHWTDGLQLPREVSDAIAFYLQPHLDVSDSLAPILSLASSLSTSAASGEGPMEAMARLDIELLARARLNHERLSAHLESSFGDLRNTPVPA